MYPEKIRSRWWYLLPILFGLVGGIIAYFYLKKNDLYMAKLCLYISISIGIPIIGGIFLYFYLKNEDEVNAKTMLSISLTVMFGLIGGFISYFILRNIHPFRAKILLGTGFFTMIINLLVNILLFSAGSFEQNFNVNL